MHATAGRQPPCVRDAKGVCGEREERVDRGEIQSGEGGGRERVEVGESANARERVARGYAERVMG